MTTTPPAVPDPVVELLDRAARLESDHEALTAIDLLTAANRGAPHPILERRLVELRRRAFPLVAASASALDDWPVPVGPDPVPAEGIPEVDRAGLRVEVLRRALAARGSLLVRGLLDPAHVAGLVEATDRAVAARAAGRGSEELETTSWFHALRLPKAEGQSLGRHWVGASGGVLAIDAPTGLFRLFEAYEEVGLRSVVSEHLGERPVLGANKTTLRRVPVDANADWHQDGAFLGTGLRTINVWVALSDCGVDAPGLDVVPRRFDEVQETGTGGAIFDWAVGPEVVATLAADAPVARPTFRAGDALLFDELCLHRTALEPTMTQPRYAIESWFFAPSAYPGGQVPLVW